MIYLNQVSKRYPSGQEALSQVSLQLQSGEMVFLTGHSGAGKTTLLKLIASLERPSSGDILINNHNLARVSKKRIPHLRRQVGFIFQAPHLLFYRTVFENVALPLIIANYRRTEINSRVRAALDKVGLLHKEKLFPETLSCGEQQRVGIARAIVRRPDIILADEPTGNLDPALSEEIMQLFVQFNQIGTTILVASHDINLIRQMPYRILTLSSGRLINDEAAKS
ncbi:MAG: cell division ATP-binding protein FtsE [Gammaproteobacteria bacterium]|jgi:cell division transport system ATP-binding protein